MLARTRALSCEEVRSIDRIAAESCALPTLVLMENAGRGAAELWRERAGWPVSPLRVVILCGPGNNGGDGAVVARHLDAWGHDVAVVWLGDLARRSGDAAVQAGVLARSGVDSIENPTDLDARLARADWVIDGLLGTGLTRPVTSGPIREAIEAINRSGRPVLALDVPSGLDADTGEPPLGGVAVEAVATATFVGPKLGMLRPGAERYCGVVGVVEIGVPRRILAAFLAP
jgi:NAD(P)H-hydrate epimerase